MKIKIRLILFASLTFLFLQSAFAQQNNQVQYLKETGIIDSIYSNTLKESREIYIQLPENYDPGSAQKYPVVFVLDGEVFLPTVSNVHDFYSGGFIPEMVLIGISNHQNRTRDLTTSTIKTKYGMPFNEENGEAEHFLKFIEKELIPYIENKYQVSNFRTLIGHSYGGLFTLYSLIHHPDLFTNYIAIDPSLDWNDQKLINDAKEILATQSFKNKALFMSLSGQLHMQNPAITIENVTQDTSDFTLFARSNIAFSDLVKQNTKNGLTFNWKFYPNDIHGTIPFPSIMDGLIAVFKWFQMENTSKINAFDTSKEELYKIVKHREQKLKDHFGYFVPPYPEELLNMSGYMNMDMQQLQKAKMYFDFALEYYPESANAYDSMADYYDAQGKPTDVIKYLNKALQISGNDYYKKRIERLTK